MSHNYVQGKTTAESFSAMWRGLRGMTAEEFQCTIFCLFFLFDNVLADPGKKAIMVRAMIDGHSMSEADFEIALQQLLQSLGNE